MKKNKGISLIILVITIIVIIILAGAVILSLANNNPIGQSKEATFKSNIETYNSELTMAISNEYLKDYSFDPNTFNKGVWNGGEIKETIKKYITTITETDGKIFEIQKGKLVYVGDDNTEKSWSTDVGIAVTNKIDKIAPTVEYGTNGGSGETASTTVTVTDEGGISASTLQYVWDTQNVTTPINGWTVFTSGQTLTKGSVNGTYYLWIKASDNMENSVVSKSNAFTLVQPVVVNKPLLVTGMTAKKWNGSSWVTVTNPNTDTTWYNYGAKQWANAQTADGSMWVWIPRYEYKIPTPHNSTAQTILINFLENTTTTATSGYIVHPAFTFGSTQLTGIWVAKFKASGYTAADIHIIPGVNAIRNLTIDAVFTACRNMETTNGSIYGWGTSGIGIDTHLTKNIEWGSIAYLSQSIYGKNGEVWINPSSYYFTGVAGNRVNAPSTTSTYEYNNMTYGVNASTTGNVYGVYDMNGCAYEYTAAYVNNGNSNLNTYGFSLVNADSKYKDVYTVTSDSNSTNYSNSSSKKGDAVYETSTTGTSYSSAWFTERSSMPFSSYPFFTRSGFYNGTSDSGLFFFYYDEGSNPYSYVGFRPVLAVSGTI